MYRSAAKTKLLHQISRRRDSARSHFLRHESILGVSTYLTLSCSRVTVLKASVAGNTKAGLCHSNFVQPVDDATTDVANIPAIVSPYEAKAARLSLERYHDKLGKLGKSGDVKKIDDMLIEMRLKGLTPNKTALQHLVLAHAKNKNAVSAQRIVDDLKLSGVQLTNRIWSYLIVAYANTGDPAAADKTFEDAIADKVLPGTKRVSKRLWYFLEISSLIVSSALLPFKIGLKQFFFITITVDMHLLTELLRAHAIAGNPTRAEEVSSLTIVCLLASHVQVTCIMK